MTSHPHDSLPAGVQLVSLTVGWSTDYSDKAIEFFKRENQSHRHSDSQIHFHLAPVLSDSDSAFMADIALLTELEPQNNLTDLHWMVRIEPRPPHEPPKDIVELNERMGGWAGVLSLVEEVKPNQHAAYSIKVDVDASNWRCRMIPRPVLPNTVDESIIAIAPDWQIEQIGYRQPTGKLGIVEFSIIFHHRPKCYRVWIQAVGGLDFNSTLLLPYAAKSIHSLMGYCFEPAIEET